MKDVLAPPGLPVGRRARFRVLLAALGAATAGPVLVLLAGTLAVQLRDDLGMSERAIGGAVTAYFVCSTLFSLVSGQVTDRVGWRWAIRIGGIASAAALLLVAGFAGGRASFVPLFLIGSIGHALAQPASNLAIAEEMPTNRLGLLFGIKQAANPVAGMFAGAAVPVLALSVGWRWAFVAAVVFPLTGVLGTLGGARRVAPSRLTGRARPRGSDRAPESSPAPPRPPLRAGPIVLLGLAGGLASVCASAIGTFVVLSAVDAGISQATAGSYVVLASFAGLVVRVASGWWVDRSGSGGIRPVAGMLVLGAVSFVVLATGHTGLILPAMVVAYAAGWGWPGMIMFGIVHHHPGAAGRATGFVQIGMMAGGAIGPVAFGLIVGASGYATAWIALAGAALLGAVSSIYAARSLDGLKDG